MKSRTSSSFAMLAALLVLAGFVAATQAAETKAKAPAKTPAKATLRGEVIDMGCYLQSSARGEKHKACASKCLANGMPMGLMTADGKLYLITLDHDNADPYNACKGWAGSNVEITGMVSNRSGIKAIDCEAAKQVD